MVESLKGFFKEVIRKREVRLLNLEEPSGLYRSLICAPLMIRNKVFALIFHSRILGVADSFDAMTTDRPYRKALKTDEAIGELQRNRNIQFDKNIVDAFIESGVVNS